MKKLIIFIQSDLTKSYAIYNSKEIYFEWVQQCDIKNKQYDKVITINTKRKIPNAKYEYNLLHSGE